MTRSVVLHGSGGNGVEQLLSAGTTRSLGGSSNSIEEFGIGIQRFLLAFIEHLAAMTANDRKVLARSRPIVAFCLDLQRLTTMFAVNRIRFVPVQAAFWAFILDFGGLEDGARQLKKKRYADDHNEYRQQLSASCRHGDVAKARRRQCSHREIERINIADDASVFIKGQHKDKRRGHEDENEQIDRGEDCVLVAAEEQVFAPKVTQQVIGVDQSQAPQHTEECKVPGDKRCQQKRHHDDQIRKGVDTRQFPAQVIGDPEAGREVQSYEQAKPRVERCDNRHRGQRRGGNEISDCQQIENDQAIAKPPGALALTGVEQPDRSMQFFHSRNMPQVFTKDQVPNPMRVSGQARGTRIKAT